MDLLLVFFALFFSLMLFMIGKTSYSFSRQLSGFSFFGAGEEDDSDIKIAGEEKSDDGGEHSVETEMNELEVQRRNGNLEKARLLGAALTEKIIGQDGESTFGEDIAEDAETRAQRRMLLAFAAINTVESNVKSEVLQGVIINVFYDTLKKSLPEFYNDIGESGSFSFYTLCVRRGGDVDTAIGQTFAMLANKSGSNVMAELGKALYMRFVDVTKNTIKSFNITQ